MQCTQEIGGAQHTHKEQFLLEIHGPDSHENIFTHKKNAI